MTKGVIYCITCKISGRQYVGSTTRDLASRWKEHQWMLENAKHHSRGLQNAWSKYGKEAFEIAMLEVVELEVIEIRETYWIEELNTHKQGYNHGDTRRRGTERTTETRTRLAESQRKRWERDGERLRAKRKEYVANRTPEQKAKQAAAARKNLTKAVASPNKRPPPKTSEMPKDQQQEIYKRRQATCKATWEAKDGKDAEIKRLLLLNWTYSAIIKELHTSRQRIWRVVKELNVD